jgi:hypothetical protein
MHDINTVKSLLFTHEFVVATLAPGQLTIPPGRTTD